MGDNILGGAQTSQQSGVRCFDVAASVNLDNVKIIKQSTTVRVSYGNQQASLLVMRHNLNVLIQIMRPSRFENLRLVDSSRELSGEKSVHGNALGAFEEEDKVRCADLCPR